MRDTSAMMEDTLSEDTMMDCGGDGGGLEDFVDLATDITDNSSTIRDAAERLLILLGMDENDDEDLAAASSSSSSEEDEGVEVDIDELEDDEEENKLLQLAASLAQELKYSQKQSLPSGSSRESQHQPARNSMHTMVDMVQDTSYLGRCLQDRVDHHPKTSVQENDFDDRDELIDERNANFTKFTNFASFRRDHRQMKPHGQSFGSSNLDRRLWTEDPGATQAERSSFAGQQEQQDPGSWTVGWDACATEALRYLVEDEGLPFHHPTVVAMRNHLDLQRERSYTQYISYTETKSQDMSLVLD